MIRLNISYRSNFTECYASEPVGDRQDLATGAGLQEIFQGLTRENGTYFVATQHSTFVEAFEGQECLL